jgi:hypothetical protein
MKNQNSKKTYGIKVRLTSDEYAILTGGYIRSSEAVNYAPSTSPVFSAYKNTLREKASAKVSRALRLAVKFKEYGVTTEKALQEKINSNRAQNACNPASEAYWSA